MISNTTPKCITVFQEENIEAAGMMNNTYSIDKGSPTQKKHVYIWALPKLQFDPPYCANPGTLWHKFFAENEKILKTAILTMGMNILTVTKV